jgi:hypothetical protein
MSGFWSDTMGSVGDWIGSNGNTLAQIGSIAGVMDNASDIRDMGHEQQQFLQEQGDLLNQNSQFKGYGVTSALGNSTVAPDGSINLGVGPDAGLQQTSQNMLQGSQNAFNRASGLQHGQGTVDWNSMGQNMAQQAQGMGVNAGPYANNSANAYQQGMGMQANTGVFGQGAEQAMNSALADPSSRQQEIFGQLMGMQQPGLDAAQAQQQAREYAMGRGGVMGSQFGGTAEDAAMAKARAQASNQAAMGAMKQADAERGMFGQMAAQLGQVGNTNYANQQNTADSYLNASAQQGQLGNTNYQNMANYQNNLASQAAQYGQLGNNAINANANFGNMLNSAGSSMGQLGLNANEQSYLPMEMQMKLLGQGQQNADMAMTGQLTGNDYMSQMLLGGSNANVNAQKVSSELTGNLYDSILDNLGGAQGEDGSAMNGIGGLLSSLGGGLDSIVDLF